MLWRGIQAVTDLALGGIVLITLKGYFGSTDYSLILGLMTLITSGYAGLRLREIIAYLRGGEEGR